MCWEPEPHGAGVVDDDGGQGDDACASCAVLDRWELGDGGGPDPDVVREDRAGEPRGVGVMVAGREMFEPGAFFQVTNHQLDGGVFAMELIGLHGVEIGAVRDERVVAPVGPKSSLRFIGETGAAHDQADAASVFSFAGGVDRFRDLRQATCGVLDVDPVVLGNRGNGRFHVFVQANRDRPADAVGVERSMSFHAQNPESARNVTDPVAPARLITATSSSTNRTAPRAVFADPCRIRANNTSPLPARVASSG